jgi:hypothetical protein
MDVSDRMHSLLLLVTLASALLPQQPGPTAIPDPLTAATIMAMVALHQDATQAARAHYIYIQHAQVTSRKGKVLRCEEITDSRVAPSAKGSEQSIFKLTGRLLKNRTYVRYTELPKSKEHEGSEVKSGDNKKEIMIEGSSEMDRDIVEIMRDNLTRDDTRDGIGSDLFPLTTKAQANYRFQLIGHDHMNGRDVFHLTFAPRDKSDFSWKGDAYIDCTAYEPVVVRTTMSRKIPFAVRALLGTSLPGLGFTVVYAPQPGGVWFPVSLGTEFKIKLFFFFHRELVLSAQNRDFEQTHVTSTILATQEDHP